MWLKRDRRGSLCADGVQGRNDARARCSLHGIHVRNAAQGSLVLVSLLHRVLLRSFMFSLSTVWCNVRFLTRTQDNVVRKEAWDGSIPIRLTLSPHDVGTYDPPLPFFIQAPRMGYLPLVLGSAKAYFQGYALAPPAGGHNSSERSVLPPPSHTASAAP